MTTLFNIRDNHTAYLKSDWVDENIQIIIIKHNYEVNKEKLWKLKTLKMGKTGGWQWNPITLPDKELLDMTPDMEGVTRPEKDKKTKKFTFIVNGECTYEVTTHAESRS